MSNQKDYDFCEKLSEYRDIAVVRRGDKFGYINREGVEITPLKYDRALQFYYDTGRVQLGGKWGLVNSRGKEITPLVYDELKGVEDPIVRLGDKYGFIRSKTGKLLTPVKYDDAKIWTQIMFGLGQFGEDDLARVCIGGKWGCINRRGEEVIPLIYDEIKIDQFQNPRFRAKLNGKWGFLDKDGKVAIAFEYDDAGDNFFFYNGTTRVKKDGKYGFINQQCVVCVPFIYDDCEPVLYNTLWVKRNGKYGFIDETGKEIIKPKYEFARSFGRGFKPWQELAAVVRNGKVGFINRKGRRVIPFMYEPDFEKRENYCFHYGFASVKYGGKWGVIDEKNNVAVPFLYDEFLEQKCDGIFRYVCRDGEQIYLDHKGNEWTLNKNAAARTFMDYLHATEWAEALAVLKKRFIGGRSKEDDMQKYKTNYFNFKSKSSKPSENIIRIYDVNGNAFANIFDVKKKIPINYFEWSEILDMEVRIEDNLTPSNAEIVALCIYEASDDDGLVVTEEHFTKHFQEMAKLKEEWKQERENGI